jgi:hypothetical protein
MEGLQIGCVTHLHITSTNDKVEHNAKGAVI